MSPRPFQPLAAVAVVALAACMHPKTVVETNTSVEVPDSWDGAALESGTLEDGWWRSFDDERLDAAVLEVLAHNQDLRAAAARVDAAAALARVAGAPLLPAIGANASAGRRRQNFVGLPIPGGEDEVLSTTATTYGVSLDLSWEVDLWGKLAAGEQAALADQRAAQAEFAAARLSLVAQAVKAWYAQTAARLQVELAEETVASFRRSYEFVERRYLRGRAQPLDLRLLGTNVAAAEALLDARQEQFERAVRQLEILLGRYPDGELVAAAELPAVVDEVPAGLPSELLLRRPDLVAAQERLAAGGYRLYAARKELWPSLTLTASGGRLSNQVEDLFDSSLNAWSLAGGLFQPIFQGGRLRGEIDLADARVREALALYGQSTLVAFADVETLLSIENLLDQRVLDLGRAAEFAGAARALAESRYEGGRNDVLAVLDSQRSSLTASAELIEARRQRLDARVDLYLALGGGFEAGGEPPADDPGEVRS